MLAGGEPGLAPNSAVRCGFRSDSEHPRLLGSDWDPSRLQPLPAPDPISPQLIRHLLHCLPLNGRRRPRDAAGWAGRGVHPSSAYLKQSMSSCWEWVGLLQLSVSDLPLKPIGVGMVRSCGGQWRSTVAPPCKPCPVPPIHLGKRFVYWFATRWKCTSMWMSCCIFLPCRFHSRMLRNTTAYIHRNSHKHMSGFLILNAIGTVKKFSSLQYWQHRLFCGHKWIAHEYWT